MINKIQPETILRIATRDGKIIDLAGNQLSSFNGAMPSVSREVTLAGHSAIDDTIGSSIEIVPHTPGALSVKNADFTISFWFQASKPNFTVSPDCWCDAIGPKGYWKTSFNIFISLSPATNVNYISSASEHTIVNRNQVDLSHPYQPRAVLRDASTFGNQQIDLMPIMKVAPTNDMKPHHFALTRKVNTYYLFYDGKLVNLYTAPNNILSFSETDATPLLCCGGSDWLSNNTSAYGYFNDICIIKNKALWTESFTINKEEYLLAEKVLFIGQNNQTWGAINNVI